jgi:hypothetical protein
MKPRDVFETIVRSTGLLLLVSWVFAFSIALLRGDGSGVLYALLIFAVGGYLLKGAPMLVEWAYSTGPSTKRARTSSNKTMQTDAARPHR